MPGVILLRNTFTCTAGGTNAMCILLPPGGRLISAAAHNGDRPFSRVKMYLTSPSYVVPSGATIPVFGSADCLPLNDGIQGGMNDQVTWFGSVKYDSNVSLFVANFWTCAAGNLILTEVGVEL